MCRVLVLSSNQIKINKIARMLQCGALKKKTHPRIYNVHEPREIDGDRERVRQSIQYLERIQMRTPKKSKAKFDSHANVC